MSECAHSLHRRGCLHKIMPHPTHFYSRLEFSSRETIQPDIDHLPTGGGDFATSNQSTNGRTEHNAKPDSCDKHELDFTHHGTTCELGIARRHHLPHFELRLAWLPKSECGGQSFLLLFGNFTRTPPTNTIGLQASGTDLCITELFL